MCEVKSHGQHGQHGTAWRPKSMVRPKPLDPLDPYAKVPREVKHVCIFFRKIGYGSKTWYPSVHMKIAGACGCSSPNSIHSFYIGIEP